MPSDSNWSRYPVPTPAVLPLGVVCSGLGAQSGQVPPVSDRILDTWALVLIDEGRGLLETARGTEILTAGTVVTIPPGLQHSYRPEPSWSERWALFSGPASAVYQDAGVLDASRAQVRQVDVGAAQRILGVMRQALARDNRILQVTLGVGIHRLLTEVVAPAGQGGSDRGEQIIRAIRTNVTADLSLPEHARQLGLTPNQLRDIVMQQVGLTPRQFITSARMEIATSLLAGSDLPVGRVAVRAGYTDAGYFTRHFHRHVGMSPSTFRHHHLRGTLPDDVPVDPGPDDARGRTSSAFRPTLPDQPGEQAGRREGNRP